MYRLDDTNDNYNETPSATEAMDSSMDFLFKNFIDPVEADLSEDQAYILAHIGIALTDVDFETLIDTLDNDKSG